MPKLVTPSMEIETYSIKATEFDPTRVGAKSNNLNKIRGKIEEWIGLPESIALQFNSLEDMLLISSNQDLKRELDVIPLLPIFMSRRQSFVLNAGLTN